MIGFKQRFGGLVKRYIHFVIPPENGAVEVNGLNGDQYAWPPPVYTIVVSIVQIILWIVDAAMQHPETTGPVAGALIYNPFKRHEAWRLLTYMFVHDGWSHLAINTIVHVFVGIRLEILHGWRVLVIYGVGVVAGSLGHSIFYPDALLAGASGGVFAFITAHIAFYILNRDVRYLSDLHFVLFCYLIVFLGVNSIIVKSISFPSHLAGGLAGLLIGIGIQRNLQVKPWKKLWWTAIAVFVLLMFTAIILNITS